MALVAEASPTDAIWGIGCAVHDNNGVLQDPRRWKGTNILGWALMEARDVLRRRDSVERSSVTNIVGVEVGPQEGLAAGAATSAEEDHGNSQSSDNHPPFSALVGARSPAPSCLQPSGGATPAAPLPPASSSSSSDRTTAESTRRAEKRTKGIQDRF